MHCSFWKKNIDKLKIWRIEENAKTNQMSVDKIKV